MLFGLIIELLTFPGVLLKSAYESSFAKLLGIKLVGKEEKKKYYDYNLFQLILKIVLQFLSLTIIACIFYLILISTNPESKVEKYNYLQYFLLWLGFSFAIHAFPSMREARYSWTKANEQKNGLLAGLWRFISLLLIGITIIEYFWGSIVYAILLLITLESLV